MRTAGGAVGDRKQSVSMVVTGGTTCDQFGLLVIDDSAGPAQLAQNQVFIWKWSLVPDSIIPHLYLSVLGGFFTIKVLSPSFHIKT